MTRCLWPSILILSVSVADAQESLTPRTVSAVKDATVMIATSDPDDPGAKVSGSGFLFRVDGPTGYIATNRHVIAPIAGGSHRSPTIRVILRSGTRGERTIPAEVVASSTDPDLAILKVSGVKDWPVPIDLGKETELVETMPVFVFGFPFGAALAPDRGRPSVVVGRGSVSSLRRDDDGKVLAVLIDGALNPGNSGGPVVDAQGRLVGVAVAAIRGAHIGIAIAPGDLLAMLAGRPEGLIITPGPARDREVELSVEVPLFDPLDNVKSMTLLYRTRDPQDPPPKPEAGGRSWEPLPGARSLSMKVQGHTGRGSLVLTPGTGGEIDLTYQVALVDGRGRTQRGRPGRYLLAIPGPGGARNVPPGLASWGDLVDPDGDGTIRVEDGGLALEVPGSLHDLNAETGKDNAPRILRRIEGDFVATVRVRGDFRPAGPSTREGAFPSCGAGLLIWLDADHFLRLERFAALRNGRVGAFLLFERHELGKVVARHNAYLEQGDVYLRIGRRGRQIQGYYGTDGRAWAETHPMEVDWPARLTVGLDAVTSSFAPLSVRFEEFSIARPTPDRPAAP